MLDLLSLVHPVLLVAGLGAAIGCRHRLGPAAGFAIAGFAVLALHYILDLVMFRESANASPAHFGRVFGAGWLPDFGGLPFGAQSGDLAFAVLHTAGLLLLVAAVLRRRSKVLVHDEEVAVGGE